MSLSPRATRAPRATGFSKKPAVAKTNRLNDAARSRAEVRSAPRAIPVDLAPLLSPYKGHGRLAVRIERLPQLARLSTGRNNGDNSWSLSLDQLEDLTYQPPEGMYEAHSLAVRIIGLDGGGSTLAVLDFPVPAGVAETEEDQDQTAEEPDSAQLPPLRAELAKLQASLVARESDLASARQKYAQAEAEKQKIETELAQGQAAWEAGQDERKCLGLSAGLLMRKGEAGPSKLNQAGDEIEMRCLREELAGLQAILAVRETALGEVRLAAQQAREAWRLESEVALSQAETTWKAGEAARLAAAEAQWQERSTAALAEARAQAEAARDSVHKIERRHLGDELEALKASLVDHKTALAQASSALEQTRERGQLDLESVLSKAEKAWKAEEAARLAAAEEQWQEKSAKALTEARTQSEAALSKTEKARRADEAARLAAADLQWQEKSAKSLTEARTQSEAALSKAKETWKADEAARLAAAESQWQQKSAKALADARTQSEAALKKAHINAETARDSDNATERRLREELTQAHSDLEQARGRWQQESEAALSKAKETWKADEAGRLAAAEAEWQEKSARTLAEATKRFEAAEAALKQLLIRTEQTRESGNAIEHRRLREELARMQASLSDREAQLAEARLTLDQSFEPPATETKIVLRPDRMGNFVERRVRERREREDEDDERPKSYLLRDLILVGALAAAVIVFYPSFQSPYPGYLPDIGTIFGSASAPPASVPAPEAPRAAEEFTVVVNHTGNVRAGPSSTAEIVSALQKGQKVATFEKRGSWTHIRMSGEPGKTETREGWIFSSFLDDPAVGNAASPSAERKVAPSDKTRSDKTPSAKTPSDKTQSDKAPSDKAPSDNLPKPA